MIQTCLLQTQLHGTCQSLQLVYDKSIACTSTVTRSKSFCNMNHLHGECFSISYFRHLQTAKCLAKLVQSYKHMHIFERQKVNLPSLCDDVTQLHSIENLAEVTKCSFSYYYAIPLEHVTLPLPRLTLIHVQPSQQAPSSMGDRGLPDVTPPLPAGRGCRTDPLTPARALKRSEAGPSTGCHLQRRT